MELEIYLARHGQNVDNVNGILNGHRDLPLTNLGREQARELALGIDESGISIDRIYTSPLIRAAETAKIVASVLGISDAPVVIPELIERDFGKDTGRPINEAVADAGGNVIKTDNVTYVLDFEDGETFPQVINRAAKALEKVREMQNQGSALLVCHGDIGKMVYVAATGKHWEDVLRNFHFGNCDLIEVNENDEAHRIKLPQHNL